MLLVDGPPSFTIAHAERRGGGIVSPGGVDALALLAASRSEHVEVLPFDSGERVQVSFVSEGTSDSCVNVDVDMIQTLSESSMWDAIFSSCPVAVSMFQDRPESLSDLVGLSVTRDGVVLSEGEACSETVG
jgi:hypothetical protein